MIALPDRWASAAATGIAGVVCAGIAGVAAGPAGALSSLAGTAVVLGFFATGIVPLLVVRGSDEASKGLATGILLLTYTLRLAVAVAILRVGATVEGLDRRWLGLAVIAGALVWPGVQVIVATRMPSHADPG